MQAKKVNAFVDGSMMTATRDFQWPERAVFRFFVCGPSTSLKTRSAIFPLGETHLDGQVFSKMAGILLKKFNFTDWPQINLGFFRKFPSFAYCV